MIVKKLKWVFLSCLFSFPAFSQSLPPQSDLLEMFQYVTDVKEQRGRNTCTIFTLTALLESLYIRDGGDPYIDFSEEWMQFLASISSSNASGGAKGSTISTNFRLIRSYGIPLESEMPYTSREWSLERGDPNLRKAQEMCGELSGMLQTRCLYGKRNPYYFGMEADELVSQPGGREFLEARESAQDFQQSFTRGLNSQVVTSRRTVKSHLLQNRPLALEVNIYYGAWNLPNAGSFGIHSESSLYSKGVITYPEPNSMDRIESPKHPARHAVLIVGYDDDVVLTYERKMRDGSIKTFERKGVYYVKNSWGRNKFGRSFRYQGRRFPGFGMISQDFAHDLGKITLVKKR